MVMIDGENYEFDRLKDENGKILYGLIDFLKEFELVETTHQRAKLKYKISFVGVITYKEYVIIVLPKFYSKLNIKLDISLEEIKKELVQTIRVLRAYSKSRESKAQDLEYLNIEESNNEIILADYILTDFIKNGLINIRNIKETKNINATVNWSKTVEKTAPIFSDNTPIYIDNISYHHKKNDVFIWIHKKALIYCHKKYSKILGYNINIKDDICNNIKLKDKEIENLLRKKMLLTYKEREKQLLKVLYMLWKNIQNKNISSRISLYGVRNFYNVWEKVCKHILSSEDSLKNNIEKPIWFTITPYAKCYAEKTLIPDVLRRYKSNLLILDAKYRNLEYGKVFNFIQKETYYKMLNNPGVEEVLKQIAYKLIFEKIKLDIGVEKIYNIFLYPKVFNDNNIFQIIGGVNLDFIWSLETEYVANVYVSAAKAMDMYINKERLSENSVNEFIETLKRFDVDYIIASRNK
ncbi:LlaJI family restriction endonuclease [Clostridium swellfunianum]|uniref:LlaJI family restriction endonuclease n=1 Tax=Clostridium swellfunianum TaxID=1367462 RepID=UPI00202F2896|nr:LlaJI family restriction endonuclease [Clostridium swellfunianum]MCM0647249.1 LlaJI family restriction endonuclease [Clostridium swellfunianum]